MPEEIKEEGRAPRRVFAPGETIFEEGETKGDVYVVVSGKVKITKHSSEDSDGDIMLTELGPDSIFGDMSLIDDQPRSATATAIEETTCIVISVEHFQDKLKRLDPFMQSIYQILAGRLREMNKKLASG